MSYSALSHGGVARVSTMVVDAPLDMGAFGIKADIIEESTPGAGVNLIPAEWTSLDLSASDNIRVYDDTELTVSNKPQYDKAKTLTIPARYTTGQTCRVTTALKTTITGAVRYVQVYVNGVAAGVEHSTDSTTFVTFTDDITVSGGDTVELWVKTGTAGGGMYLGLFRVCGDDALPDVFFTVGEAWP